MYESKDVRIHIFHCDRCKEKIFEGDKQRFFSDRMNKWPVTFKNHLGHMQTFYITIDNKDTAQSAFKGPESHFCLDCAKEILQTAMNEGEFTYDNS